MRSLLHPSRLLVVALVCLLGYALVGFFLLPYLITRYGVPAAAERLQHPVVVREVALNPFTLSLRLNGLEVREKDETPILGFEELFVNLHGTTLFMQTIGFDEIRLIMPFVSARVDPEGKLNLLALMPPSDKNPPDAQPPAPAEPTNRKKTAIVIDDLMIDRGIVEFLDRSKPTPISIDIVPVHIALRNFSTVEGGENAYAFTAEIGKGEGLAWEGSFSLDPLQSDGKLNMTGLQAQTLYQAVQDRFQFDVRQGELALSATYHFDLSGGVPNVLIKNGKLALRKLLVGERGIGDSLIDIPSFDVEDFSFDLAQRSVSIGKMLSADARFEAWVDPDGVLNYQRLLGGTAEATPTSTASSPAKDEAPKPWSIAVKEIGLRNYRVLFEDRTLARPSHLEVADLALSVKDARVPFVGPLPVELSLTLNDTGHMDLRGNVAMEPIGADLDLTVKQVAIRPFQPYFDRFIDADVRDGAVDLTGNVHYAQVHPKGPLIRFQGNVAVNQFSLTDRTEFQDVASWKSLAINRIALDVTPTSVKIAEIVWEEPAVRAVIGQDGKLNVSRLLVQTDAAPQPQKPQSSPSTHAPAPNVSVQTIKLVKAGAIFHDLSIQPPVRTGITDLTGTIKGLSSKELAKATVSFAGKVGAGAPLKIDGQINPLTEDAYTDLTVLFENLDLTTASPYAGKYAGYPIVNGKLFLDLKYKVAKRELIGENKVLVDQLAFGGKTDSPDATSLPVPLAVALLKDRKGQIDVDLPVRGDLNDPEFKYGRAVLNAVMTLLTKVATSPLSLLGSLVDGGEDEMKSIEFEPGRDRISDDEMKKLATLEKVLAERPGLFLEITGTADPKQDGPALAEEKFKTRLNEMKRQKTGSDGAQAAMSPEEEARLIDLWYEQIAGKTQPPASDEPTTAKRARLLETLSISEGELRGIAEERARAIRARLMESGAVEQERVVLRESQLKEGNGAGIQADLALAGRS